MANGSPAEEYRDLTENMRHYGNMRFAQLTLYFAFTAGLATALFLAKTPLSEGRQLAFKIIGSVGAFAFGVMEERAATNWHDFRRRAVDLEVSLGYKQFTSRRSARVFSATNATRLLIWGGVPFWILAAIFWT